VEWKAKVWDSMGVEAQSGGSSVRKDQVRVKLKSFVPKNERAIGINCFQEDQVYAWARTARITKGGHDVQNSDGPIVMWSNLFCATYD
jgi:hypothetical protein